jgi:hypothetical protein
MRATCLSEREFCPFPEFGAEAFLIAPAQGDEIQKFAPKFLQNDANQHACKNVRLDIF